MASQLPPGFDPEPEDYSYNKEDKVRRSHDVRIFEDGSMWLLNQDGTVADSDKDEVPNDENGDPDTSNGGKNYVDVRRTDLMRVIRGRGRNYMESYFHFLWENEGKDMPESRETEDLEVGSEDPEVSETVSIPLIKSLVLMSATNSTINPFNRWPQWPTFIGKRIFFENGDNEGRKIKIKTVGGGKVEVVKSFVVAAGQEAFYRDSNFVSEVWGDPTIDKTLYNEGSKFQSDVGEAPE